MKKVDFNFKIEGGLNEAGQPVKSKASEGLANLLETAQIKDEFKIEKYFDWALDLKVKGILELDNSDILELKKFIVNHNYAYVFFKKPVLNVLNNASGKNKEKS